jgi:hypothetical protein
MTWGEVEVVDFGAEEDEPWIRPGRRAVVREPPERGRCGRGGKAAVHPAGGDVQTASASGRSQVAQLAL